MSQGLAEELWRVGDVRGHYTTKFADDPEVQENQEVLRRWTNAAGEDVLELGHNRPLQVPADRLPSWATPSPFPKVAPGS